MARTWLSIRVELVSGMDAPDLWPRPGRLLLARPGMTFRMLADAINDAFARWDRSHLHAFTLSDGSRIAMRTPWDEADSEDLDDTQERLTRLGPGERFAFEFDLGDSWMHLCTVGDRKVDPVEVYGEAPDRPVAYFGWGWIPDQYGRRFDGDDGTSPVPDPPDPPLSDLPDLHYTWGSRAVAPPPSEVAAGPWVDDDVTAGSQLPDPEPWTYDAIQDLRRAIGRRDPVAVVDLLLPRVALEVAHLAAPALIHGVEVGHDPAGLVMLRLVPELRARGWLGDDELADEFERMLGGEAGDLRPTPVRLDDLTIELDQQPGYDEGWLLEIATGPA
jgi:hypothetical protein